MNRYWVSWWSEDKDEVETPFTSWISGQMSKTNEIEWYSFCALIDADSRENIEAAIAKYYPDYEMRFCDMKESDYILGNRFPAPEGGIKTSLTV